MTVIMSLGNTSLLAHSPNCQCAWPSPNKITNSLKKPKKQILEENLHTDRGLPTGVTLLLIASAFPAVQSEIQSCSKGSHSPVLSLS